MGRRKSRAKPEPKKRLLEKLDKVFPCPFCNNLRSVVCEIDKKLPIGTAICYICNAHYSTRINKLTESIDIYSEWIDECERVNTVEEALID
ncbi:hypothetical protein MKW94_005072 [Papaver nudicaule]|uniref:Transcription elongation factor 1 homolog n=1 Tax=Papaver nudicaule TaxID=74823 RepID=A0AA41SDC5_PAPNU|nr:hypothetical protein [Papaver nudicaule]